MTPDEHLAAFEQAKRLPLSRLIAIRREVDRLIAGGTPWSGAAAALERAAKQS